MNMLSNYESSLMSRLVDINWEIQVNSSNKLVREALVRYYSETQEELEESMGREQFRNFMDMGRKMFAPKES